MIYLSSVEASIHKPPKITSLTVESPRPESKLALKDLISPEEWQAMVATIQELGVKTGFDISFYRLAAKGRLIAQALNQNLHIPFIDPSNWKNNIEDQIQAAIDFQFGASPNGKNALGDALSALGDFRQMHGGLPSAGLISPDTFTNLLNVASVHLNNLHQAKDVEFELASVGASFYRAFPEDFSPTNILPNGLMESLLAKANVTRFIDEDVMFANLKLVHPQQVTVNAELQDSIKHNLDKYRNKSKPGEDMAFIRVAESAAILLAKDVKVTPAGVELVSEASTTDRADHKSQGRLPARKEYGS